MRYRHRLITQLMGKSSRNGYQKSEEYFKMIYYRFSIVTQFAISKHPRYVLIKHTTMCIRRYPKETFFFAY